MVDHRRTPGRKAYVLPGWFLSVTAVVCVVALFGLGWVVLFGPEGDTAPASASTPTPTPSATTSPTATPSESPTPKPKPKPKPTVSRQNIGLSVLNASRTVGIAKTVGQRATTAGWTVVTVANWRTGAAQSAVHYPAGHQDEAKLLAKDLGISAVLPSTDGMRSDRLTVILLSLP